MMNIFLKDFPMILHKIIERANQESQPFECFKEKYGIYERDGQKFEIIYKNKSDMSKESLKWCFKLVESNVSSFYKMSTLGWTPKKKQQDINKNWARFLIVRDVESKENVGFALFRFDEDYNRAALYCYELQIRENYQGKGIGTHLIKCMEQIARSLNLECIILTVLTNNEQSLKFYEKMEFELDESNKKGEKAFKILSKKLLE